MNFIIRLVVMILIFGGFIYFINKGKDDRENKALAELEPYNNQIERYLKKNLVTKNRIPAKGNIIFVNEKTSRVDKFSDYTIIPYNQPKDPGEIDSVVLHNCEYVQVGSYSNGSKAMQHVCDFTVIDVATGTWSSWGKFKGSMPSEEIRRKRGSSSDETGGRAIYSFFDAGGLVARRTTPQ